MNEKDTLLFRAEFLLMLKAGDSNSTNSKMQEKVTFIVNHLDDLGEETKNNDIAHDIRLYE